MKKLTIVLLLPLLLNSCDKEELIRAKNQLLLISTSTASKGNILFGESPYYEWSDMLGRGIGVPSPEFALNIGQQGSEIDTIPFVRSTSFANTDSLGVIYIDGATFTDYGGTHNKIPGNYFVKFKYIYATASTDSDGGVFGGDPLTEWGYNVYLAQTDSLWTETPAIKDASTAAVTVGEEFTTSAGRLKAIKFWKNETAGNYVVTLWHPNGASLFSQQYKSTTTGWQKITMDLPLEAGTYVIGVYFPNGKYVYTNGLNPRTRTNLTGNKGLFSGGNSKPGGSYTASFFIDAVIEYGTTIPLSVKTSPDREATMYKDSVGVSAVATGYTKFQWTVEDFEGRFTLKDTNTLKPYVIPLDSSGCRVWLFCTVTDASGNQMADAVAIRVAPHPKMVMGYYLWNGTFVWRVPPTFIELPTPAIYVRP